MAKKEEKCCLISSPGVCRKNINPQNIHRHNSTKQQSNTIKIPSLQVTDKNWYDVTETNGEKQGLRCSGLLRVASSGNSSPTFRDNLSIQPLRVKNPGFLTLKDPWRLKMGTDRL